MKPRCYFIVIYGNKKTKTENVFSDQRDTDLLLIEKGFSFFWINMKHHESDIYIYMYIYTYTYIYTYIHTHTYRYIYKTEDFSVLSIVIAVLGSKIWIHLLRFPLHSRRPCYKFLSLFSLHYSLFSIWLYLKQYGKTE